MTYATIATVVALALALISNGIAEAFNFNLPFRYYIGVGILSGMIVLLVYSPVHGVDMGAVRHIESRGNPHAVGDAGERGLYQIMPIVLKSYNQRHKQNYSEQDLFNSKINKKIADWYLHSRIPEMLKYYNIEVNDYNILWAYNAGIGRVREGVMPETTKDYIQKYQGITGR